MYKILPEQIVGRVFEVVFVFSLLSFLSVNYVSSFRYPWFFALGLYSFLFVFLTLSRFSSRACINWFRPELINKYMVRHFIQSSIMGWAQVTGFRGEMKELSQMGARIRKDIWYVENWSFWLDLCT